MKTQWPKPFSIGSIEDAWDNAPFSPGIYLISLEKSIRRMKGVDKTGILYVGKSSNLRSRLRAFWNCWHPASGFLWDHLKLANIILGKTFQNKDDLGVFLGKLRVKVASLIFQKELEKAERAVLYSYMFRYGELPPLNFSLPLRWRESPKNQDLHWVKLWLVHNR